MTSRHLPRSERWGSPCRVLVPAEIGGTSGRTGSRLPFRNGWRCTVSPMNGAQEKRFHMVGPLDSGHPVARRLRAGERIQVYIPAAATEIVVTDQRLAVADEERLAAGVRHAAAELQVNQPLVSADDRKCSPDTAPSRWRSGEAATRRGVCRDLAEPYDAGSLSGSCHRISMARGRPAGNDATGAL